MGRRTHQPLQEHGVRYAYGLNFVWCVSLHHIAEPQRCCLFELPSSTQTFMELRRANARAVRTASSPTASLSSGACPTKPRCSRPGHAKSGVWGNGRGMLSGFLGGGLDFGFVPGSCCSRASSIAESDSSKRRASLGWRGIKQA